MKINTENPKRKNKYRELNYGQKSLHIRNQNNGKNA